MPPFGASILFEMYECRSEYYVQLIYRRDNSECTSPVSLPCCGTMCKLDRLLEIYADILPTDDETYDSLCEQQ